MGIESDQLVYDYLSRVGDLAQQRQLPSGDRMRLVSSLRNEIDKQRAKYGSETPATVRRVLGRFGTPEEVVERAASGSGSGSGFGAPYVAESAPDVAVPVQRDRLFPGRGKRVPRPRPREADEAPPALPAPPHLAGMDELGVQGDEPDWWRVEPGPLGGGAGDSVAGFVGGVEIPELLKPPEEGEQEPGDPVGSAEAVDEDVEADDLVEEAPARRRGLRLRRRAAEVRPGLTNPLLLLAAALLVAGALFGLWLALGAGWLLAYASRRLSRAESKWAVLGMPGLTLLGGLIWLWGRQDGRWGDPIAQGEMGAALTGMWPWLIRVAAVSSAGFLVWRSQRGGR
ncbi:hypothetical protein [Streptomyces violascens]|uniref:Membrane protein n=1 Tax=Streptomyces violascens TaxID=67381 RepID=A0ABQ3QQL5_9ACTN|nr:hypothetical protein [Streptomyces violascens]GGU20839.1 membrane protein [Streptomyces violascens]GHI39540.1 membrane protein [Streptomyces violascens]